MRQPEGFRKLANGRRNASVIVKFRVLFSILIGNNGLIGEIER
jgi:hypothetical protein